MKCINNTSKTKHKFCKGKNPAFCVCDNRGKQPGKVSFYGPPSNGMRSNIK